VTRELDELVRWFLQRHGAELGIPPDGRYRAVRLEGPGDTSERHCIRFERGTASLPLLVLLKRYARERGKVDVANELRALRIAHATLGSAGACRAPAPYACNPDEGALFMEYCPSRPLNQAIFASLRWSRVASTPRSRARLVELAATAGDLLLRLQAARVEDLPDGPVPTSAQVLRGYQALLDGWLREWRSRGLPSDLARRVAEYVGPRLEAPAEGSARLVFQHSDFGPWNLLYRPGALYATDFHTSRPGYPEYDAAFFATALDSLRRYRIVDPALVVEMRSAFLPRASGSGTLVADRPRFQAFRAMHMVYLAVMLIDGRVPLHERIYRPRPPREFIADWFDSLLNRN
jgi:aminoglycoside phosphotransferase (APT) family kinase protein